MTAEAPTGLLRVIVGSGMMVAPRLAGGVWLGGPETRSRRHLVRAVGARDIVLGTALLAARRKPRWMYAVAAADVVDAAVSTAAAARNRRALTAGIAGVATASAVVTVALARSS